MSRLKSAWVRLFPLSYKSVRDRHRTQGLYLQLAFFLPIPQCPMYA